MICASYLARCAVCDLFIQSTIYYTFEMVNKPYSFTGENLALSNYYSCDPYQSNSVVVLQMCCGFWHPVLVKPSPASVHCRPKYSACLRRSEGCANIGLDGAMVSNSFPSFPESFLICCPGVDWWGNVIICLDIPYLIGWNRELAVVALRND